MNNDIAVEIDADTYWLGAQDSHNDLHCNTYLITDGDEGILIDPGPAFTFQTVAAKVKSILPIEKLRSIILLHQDPDAAGSTPLFEKAGFSGTIAASKKTSLIAAYYGITSSFYILEDHDRKITFRSGKEIRFFPAPYLHFPGAVMAYDPVTRFLFSGNLFGAFSKDWSLYADEKYLQAMKEFHRDYMPGNDFLRPVMELLSGLDISAVCPQHGSIITDNIEEYIASLRDLQCGLFLTDLKHSLTKSEKYAFFIDLVREKLTSSFGDEEVGRCFQEFQTKTETGDLEFNEMWNILFNQVYAFGGHRWLAIAEPLIERLNSEFSISRPDIYYSALIREKKKTSRLSEEKKYLEAVNASLQGNLDLALEEMTRDQLTGLYNENFLVKYLLNIFNESGWKNFTCFFIQIDNMRQLNKTIGEQKGNELISGIGSLLLHQKNQDDYLFRIGGPVFVLICPESTAWEATIERAEELRNSAARERGFLEHITISLGIVSVEFDQYAQLTAPAAMEQVFTAGKMLLHSAAHGGGNKVETHIEQGEDRANFGRVVIVEYDSFHAQLIGDALETLSIDYRICMNGPEALKTITEFHPDVIVSELFLLETDAFSLKEELDTHSKTSEIPIILVSHQKNESTIARAMGLGIVHYLKKPYMLPELLGIINTYVLKAMKHV